LLKASIRKQLDQQTFSIGQLRSLQGGASSTTKVGAVDIPILGQFSAAHKDDDLTESRPSPQNPETSRR
jgi:hypothetical protein